MNSAIHPPKPSAHVKPRVDKGAFLNILCSLNKGGYNYTCGNVPVAIEQYNQLVEKGIIGGNKI